MSEITEISIIVPVYNVEKYVGACIESILAQTYQNFELILVNDGSRDSSLEICEIYARTDGRIHIVNQENQGVTVARRNGVARAKGRYITFVDGDDTLPERSIEHLFSAVDDKTGIVIGNINNNIRQGESISAREYKMRCIMGHIFPGPVAKLFKKELFDDFTFEIPRSIVKGEDMIMNVRIAFNCNDNIQLISDDVYTYRQHELSCMAQFRTNWEYEGCFYEQLFRSVPKRYYDAYIDILMKKAVEVWNDFWGYRYRLPADYLDTDFTRFLLRNIQEYPNSLSAFSKLEIKSTNPVLRFILVNIKRIYINLGGKL